MSGATDELTVVIVAIVGGAALERTASAVRASGARFLTIDADGRCRDPDGRVLCDEPVRSVPGRRQQAARCVRTPFVAFIEDTVSPSDSWLASIAPALRHDGVAAVGGPVAVSPSLPSRCRALGLSEYARFHRRNFPRLATSRRTDDPVSVAALPGANFAFRTEGLLDALARTRDGLVDNEVFARLRDAGQALIYEPGMEVVYGEAHPAGASLAARFDHGRIYAGRAYANAGPGRRAVAAMKALALPAVLSGRTLVESLRSRQFSVGAMAWAVAMHLCWSAGEFAGATLGPGRHGVERWT